MFRRLPFLILAVALLIAIEPAVHSHPLTGNNACAVCAAGPTQLPATAPAIAAPHVVVSIVAARMVGQPSTSIALPIASRAPPAA